MSKKVVSPMQGMGETDASRRLGLEPASESSGAVQDEARRGMGRPVFYGVGVGPGDPGLLTLKAVRTLESCGVILAPCAHGGASEALAIAQAAVDLEAKRIVRASFPMTRDHALLAANYARVAEEVVAALDEGEDVAMPVLGDPGVYSTYGHVASLVADAGHQTRTIPGVPSFCAVSAALGNGLAEEPDDPIRILPAGLDEDDLTRELLLPGTKVIMKSGRSLPRVRALLGELGLLGRTSLVRDCGMPDEQVIPCLGELVPQQGGSPEEPLVGETSYLVTLVVR